MLPMKIPLYQVDAFTDKLYALRWFTPASEVDLCGHATLASAHVILGRLEPGREEVRFSSKSGPLRVSQDRGRLWLDFPARPPVASD